MSRWAWLTPDNPAGESLCRVLSVPLALWPHVYGALGELLQTWNWEAFGTMTVQEAIDALSEVVSDFETQESLEMIGAVMPFAGTLPGGVLPCDGTTYQRVDYPLLYARIDAAFIVDADHFKTPDLSGRAVIGSGSGSGLTPRSIGDQGGEESHLLTTAEMPSHNHGYGDAGLPDVPVLGPGEIPVNALNNPALTTSTGGGGTHNTMMPFTALRYGIVATSWALCGGAAPLEVAILLDRKPADTDGGTATGGGWFTRDLNYIQRAQTWVTLDSNQFSLGEGSFLALAFSDFRAVNRVKLAFLDVNSAIRLPSRSAMITGGTASTGTMVAAAILSGSPFPIPYAIQYKCAATRATDGLGVGEGSDWEVYTTLVLVKL